MRTHDPGFRLFVARAVSLCSFLALPLTLGSPRSTLCQENSAAADVATPEESAAEFFTPPARNAADKGLDFLAKRQVNDGSFGSAGYSQSVAVCALSGMAFLSSGSTPGRGKFGGNLGRAVDFILDHTDESGFISVAGSATHGPMYGHGFATMFLAEAYGMSMRAGIR